MTQLPDICLDWFVMCFGGVSHGVALRVRGMSMISCCSRRCSAASVVVLATVASTVILMLIVGVTSALACDTGEPPQFRELEKEEVFATRARIEVDALQANTEPPLAVKWQAKYSTSPDGPWIPAGEETVSSDHFTVALGAPDATDKPVLHHLKPETTYYVLLQAENKCSEEDKIVPKFETTFTTTSILKPEIASTFSESTTFGVFVAGPSTAVAEAQIETNGSETKYYFEYTTEPKNSLSWHEFTSGGSGTVTVAEDFVDAKASVTKLSPETTYFVRLRASNEVPGETIQPKYSAPGGGELESFTTPSASPVTFTPSVRNVTGTSAHVSGKVNPHGLETKYYFEYTTDPSKPTTWSIFSEGTIEAGLPEGAEPEVEAKLTALKAGGLYFVRLCASSSAGEGENGVGEPCLNETQQIESFQAAGAPVGTALATHALHGKSLRLLGEINPNSVPTSAEQTVTIEGNPTGGSFTLAFEGEATAPIGLGASAESVDNALRALPAINGHGSVAVSGGDGGPYTVYFGGGLENGFVGKAVPTMTGNGSNLIPSSAVTVLTTQNGGEAYDTHYHFEYASQKQFEAEGGFAKASSSPEIDLGSGGSSDFVGEDIPGLVAGEVYHYRLSATNNPSGDPVVHGEEQTLTVPVAASPGLEEPCSNQTLRSGPSENLPDCRAYEQVTPVDKHGSQEIFRYEGLAVKAIALVGEDGNHLAVEAPVSWGGSGASVGQEPYFFSRTPEGWQMTAATPQPEAGVNVYTPQVFSPDLTQIGFESSFATSAGNGESKNVEFRTGPPGGPYVTVASVPKEQAGAESGWVAASADFSKLILQVEDRRLVEPQTTTKSGSDLYEYSGGTLRQVNIGVGECGANIVKGNEEDGGGGTSSSHAVSTDGSRVFFEAVPGTSAECSTKSKQLYVRANGGSADAETIDLGAYRFVAANSEGTEVLLEKSSGENPGLYLMSGSAPARFLPSTGLAVGASFVVSDDLSTVYFDGAEEIYGYNIPTKTLSFIAHVEHGEFVSHVSPNGHYYYFVSRRVGGLPGGAVVPGGGQENDHTLPLPATPTQQVYRYDSVEHVIQCISCASSFDPEPKLGATFGTGPHGQSNGLAGLPRLTLVSGNGDFAFFQTPAALVPSDVDGEVTPEGTAGLGLENPSTYNSVSGDVYEWRHDGVDGCVDLQGCLALITNGRGGILNLLLGSAEEGRDVFIYTSSKLVPQDTDTAGDIYDARIGGGFPPPAPSPVECEADACSTPASAPDDVTPASFTFTGVGNIVQSPSSKPVANSKRPKAKKKAKKKRKGKKTGKSIKKGRTVKRSSGRDK